jgi:hypothetical protein
MTWVVIPNKNASRNGEVCAGSHDSGKTVYLQQQSRSQESRHQHEERRYRGHTDYPQLPGGGDRPSLPGGCGRAVTLDGRRALHQNCSCLTYPITSQTTNDVSAMTQTAGTNQAETLSASAARGSKASAESYLAGAEPLTSLTEIRRVRSGHAVVRCGRAE